MPNLQLPNLGAGVFVLIAWEFFWKGVGLWKSAKKGHLAWFIAIMLVNLFGILPIFYLWKNKQLYPFLQDAKNFFKSAFNKR